MLLFNLELTIQFSMESEAFSRYWHTYCDAQKEISI